MPLWRSWRLGARDTLNYLHNTDELFLFYMGKNTPERQDFIIGNLKVEKDLVEA
jgi:topoisomerase-4 subunit B